MRDRTLALVGLPASFHKERSYGDLFSERHQSMDFDAVLLSGLGERRSRIAKVRDLRLENPTRIGSASRKSSPNNACIADFIARELRRTGPQRSHGYEFGESHGTL